MRQAVVGIDLGGTNIRAGLVLADGQRVREARTSTQGPGGTVVERVVDLVRSLRDASRGQADVVAVGVGSAGVVDRSRGMVLSSVNIPGWTNIPLRDGIQEPLGLPVVLENDANAAALGEMWQGAGRAYRHFVLLTLGTGVGGGVILDGRIWHGVHGVGGEVGHVTVDPDGPRCNCGNRGCLEQYASATAVVRYVREAGSRGEATPLAQSQDLTAEAVARAARQGDRVALGAFQQVGRALGIALAGLANILDPQAFILGGGLLGAWDLFIGPLEKELRWRAYPQVERPLTVCPATLGDDAGILGAARLAWDEIGREGGNPEP